MIKTKKKFKDKKSNFKETLESCSESILKSNSKDSRKMEGITLIALVLTIVILIILATITINFAFGENGLIRSAESARDFYANDTKYTEESISNVESYIDGIINDASIEVEQVTDGNPGQLEQESDTTLVINSIEDLVFFSYDVTNNGNTYEGKTVKLGLSLDFNSNKSYVDPNSTDYIKYGYNGPLKQSLVSGSGFIPIGDQREDGTKYFYGTFDGDNKAICSLYININSNQGVNAGFFSKARGNIKNLGLVNADVIVVGALANVGILSASGGTSENNIFNCYATGKLNVTGNSWMCVGGLCGVASANIENCYNLVNIECKDTYSGQENMSNISCGGIVGRFSGVNINKCYNKGNIICDGGNNAIIVAGICGSATNQEGNIKNCYNNGKIETMGQGTRSDKSLSGIVANSNLSDIAYCYNSGELVCNAENSNIGGIVAIQHKALEISNIFNIGKIDVKEENINYLGGIIATISAAEANVNMNNAYNTGIINVENPVIQEIGSIAGYNWNNLITFNNCNYLLGTYDKGVGVISSYTGVIELDSIDKFPSVLEVVNVEGVFEEDRSNINNGYPILSWQQNNVKE